MIPSTVSGDFRPCPSVGLSDWLSECFGHLMAKGWTTVGPATLETKRHVRSRGHDHEQHLYTLGWHAVLLAIFVLAAPDANASASNRRDFEATGHYPFSMARRRSHGDLPLFSALCSYRLKLQPQVQSWFTELAGSVFIGADSRQPPTGGLHADVQDQADWGWPLQPQPYRRTTCKGFLAVETNREKKAAADRWIRRC